MFIYVFGEENYLIQQKIKDFRDDFIKKHAGSGNVIVFDCTEKCDVREICDMCGVQDLFSSEKMIIIKNFIQSTKIDEQKKLQKALRSSDMIIFVEHGIPRKNAHFVGWLGKNAQEVHEMHKLDGKDLSMWIVDHVVRRGGRIDRSAIEEIILYIGNDLWRIVQEVDKLIAYAHDREIVRDDVQLLVHGYIDANMFATIESVFANDKGRALYLLKQQLAKGDEPFHILSMYIYHIRTLLMVGDAAQWGVVRDRTTIAKIAGVHPFVVQKTLGVIDRISLKQLTRAHRHLTRLDKEIKTGKRDIVSALDLFVMHA